KREANILGALEEARQSQTAAKAELDKARAELLKAAADARGIVETARRDAEALKAEKREEGVKDAQTQRERAKGETEAQAEAKRKELYEEVAKLAALMAQKALGRAVTIEDHRRLLDESLAELKSEASKV